MVHNDVNRIDQRNEGDLFLEHADSAIDTFNLSFESLYDGGDVSMSFAPSEGRELIVDCSNHSNDKRLDLTMASVQSEPTEVQPG